MKKYKYGISITTYNRPEYLSQFLETFRNTNFLEGTVVRILDDDSSNKETLEMLNNFKIDNPNVELHIEHNLYNMGPVYNYTKNIIKFENDDVDYIINLDSDSIHNPEWLNKINEINNHFGPKVLSSVFWCDHGYPHEKIQLEETFLKTRSLNGLCLCFPKYFMQDFIDKKGSRSFDGFTSYDLKKKYNLDTVVTELSYVEHIGLHGVNYPPDIAKKFVGI
jgi:hypothetical protein